VSRFALRAVTARDRGFLLRVYAATRADELAVVPWSDAQRAAFVRAQFTAQDAYWSAQRPDTTRQIIEVGGRPAGRLYVDRTLTEIRVVEIALLPEFRGRGIGTRLLGRLLAEGEAAGLPVTIHIEQGNRARRLYERLGFSRVGDAGVYDLYERRSVALREPTSCLTS